MKTKLFVSFLLVIMIGLLANLFFEQMILRDFDSYVNKVREDRLHWIHASVEDCYHEGIWDKEALHEAVHWAMMLGMHVKVQSQSGEEISSSGNVMTNLSDSMRRHMSHLFDMDAPEAAFEPHTLMKNNERIGMLLVHYFPKKQIFEQEAAFKRRTVEFFYTTILIAGCGSLLLALLSSQLLSKPLTRLKQASERIAAGDFSVRTETSAKDEIGKLSEAFNRMAESLQKEERLRRHLTSNVAHELRTPLTIIKAQIEAITDGIVDRDKGLETVRNEAERLIALVKGIEDVTAAEASFFSPPKAVEVNLGEFLKGHVDEMHLACREKGLVCEIGSRNDILVITDDEKLEKVIQNLLSNAFKFTEVGNVTVNYGVGDKFFFIEVADTGRGIPEEMIPHIFDRFYRADDSRTSGLGLGLSIVKELVDVMGGTIDVRSAVGEGTRIRVELPDGASASGSTATVDASGCRQRNARSG